MGGGPSKIGDCTFAGECNCYDQDNSSIYRPCLTPLRKNENKRLSRNRLIILIAAIFLLIRSN